MGDKINRPKGQFRSARAQILRIYLLLAGVALILSGFLVLKSFADAYSALLGALIFLIPSLYFAVKALDSRVQAPDKVLKLMYLSEIWKVALTVLGFALVFKFVHPLSPLSLFLTFILMHILHWVAQIRLNKRFLKL